MPILDFSCKNENRGEFWGMPALKNLKHEAFAQAVANGSTGVQAYRSEISDKCTTKSAMEQASVLLSDLNIASRVEELQKKARDTLEKRLGWSKEKAVAYLVEVLETPVGELHNMHRLTNEMTVENRGGSRGKLYRGNAPEGNEQQSEDVEVVKLKGISKADAMKQLAAMAGWNEPEKIEHSGTTEIIIRKL